MKTNTCVTAKPILKGPYFTAPENWGQPDAALSKVGMSRAISKGVLAGMKTLAPFSLAGHLDNVAQKSAQIQQFVTHQGQRE